MPCSKNLVFRSAGVKVGNNYKKEIDYGEEGVGGEGEKAAQIQDAQV